MKNFVSCQQHTTKSQICQGLVRGAVKPAIELVCFLRSETVTTCMVPCYYSTVILLQCGDDNETSDETMVWAVDWPNGHEHIIKAAQ